MKRILFFLVIALFSHLPQTINAQEYYLKISEKDKKLVNTTITQTVSIDKVEGETIYAYANSKELAKLKALGYTPEMLPSPTSAIKNRAMATTVEQMANWDKYPTYEVYRSMMKQFEEDYPTLCKLDSIGTTVEGRKLYVVKISDNVINEEAEPEFFYTSTMHGDETTGYILMLRLIDYLLSNYGTDSRITDMVDGLAIYINPNANPDGTYNGGNSTVNSSTRYNANGVDINRDFPDPRIGANSPYAIETQAFMNYAESRNFVFSANFHGGIELANFPWDAWDSSDNPHPDHNWFYTVSRQYADQAQADSPSGYFTGEDNGVTQGGDWYVVSGGRQDYMNYWHNCKEITMEVSNTKNPASTELPNFWNYNKEALLSYIEWLYTGIQGTVTNEQGDPLNATITIDGHDQYNSHVVTNPNTGLYVRMIEPGTYSVMYSAEGYISQVHSLTVSNYTSFVPKDVVLVQAAQTSLAGVVTDSETGNPINGVKVELLNSSTISPVYTNASGEYSFGSIPENTYQVKASMQGYLSQTVTQTLTGESNTINFTLAPSNAESFEVGVPEGFAFEGGNWVRDNSTAYDGDFSMKSASITDEQTTSMEITLNVVSSAEIVFFYKVSSESGYDHLKFYIDGSLEDEWSGEVDWTEVSFPVTSGVHTFSWTYEKDGSVSNGSDCAWVDNIIFPQTQSDVVFTVTYNGSPVQGASVSFNESTLTSTAAGQAVFSNVLRGTSGSYTVEKSGFITEEGSLSVGYVDISEQISLTSEDYSVSFTVTDGINPIDGAAISINSQQLTTNAQGEASIMLPNGSFSYNVTKEGYHDQSGNVTVNANDAELEITLVEETEPVYNVTFHVYIDEQDIEGATVSFNGQQEETDASGLAVFAGVAAGTYSYTVTCSGYENYTDELTVVDADITEEVTLVISSVINAEWNVEQLSMWPNPFTDNLNIRFNLNSASNVTVEVYTITGQKVATIANGFMHKGEQKVEWNALNGNVPLVPGVYLVQIKTNEGQQTARVIFSGK